MHERIPGIAPLSPREAPERYIVHLANHDSLTDLPNRQLLLHRLEEAVRRARKNRERLAFLFLDLDHFKTINDSLGPALGDLLLQAVAGRLRACVPEEDTVGRLGGDEFTVMLPRVTHFEQIRAAAERIGDALNPRFVVGGRELFISASMGVSVFPNDGQDADSLLGNADAAMYSAKRHGRNTCRFYSPAIDVRASERLVLGVALRHALDRREFFLHYQPEIDLQTGRIVGVEALIRWEPPALGPLKPERFIPVAEENGLIVPIGEWVLRSACAQNRAWQDEGIPPFRVAVNLSSQQFNRSGLLSTVVGALRDSRLHPRHLELELTESGIMYNEAAAVTTLKHLKSTGLRLTIDDFGTGYSSLNHLKKFPIDALKIDQSFVRDMTSHPQDATIVKAIISMAHGLHLEVIGEGVETSRQAALLRKHRCDHFQGYFYSHPLPPEEFSELLATNPFISGP